LSDDPELDAAEVWLRPEDPERVLPGRLGSRLGEPEQLVDLLDAAAAGGVFIWDLRDRNRVWSSERFLRLLGYGTEIRSTWLLWDRVDPELAERAEQAFTAHLSDPTQPYLVELRYRHREGGWVWIRSRGVVLRDPEGVPDLFVCFNDDVTDLVDARIESDRALGDLRTRTSVLELLDGLTLELQEAATPQLVLDLLVRSLVGGVGDVCAATEPQSAEASYYAGLGAAHGQDELLLEGMFELIQAMDRADQDAPPPWLEVRGGAPLLADRVVVTDLEESLGLDLPTLRQVGEVSFVVVPWSRRADFEGAVVVARNLQRRPPFTDEDVQIVRQVVDRHADVYAARRAQVGEATNRRFRELVRSAPIGILQFDTSGRCVYANASWAEVSGRARRDALGDGWRSALPPETVESLVAGWRRLERGGAPILESCWLAPGSGRRRAVSMSAIGEWDEAGVRVGTIVTVVDETARRVAEDRLRRQAGDDPLTGLANRRRFFEVLERSLAIPTPGRRLAVVYVDLDRFKQVNDLLGHEAGDRVLVDVARRLRSVARAGDTVARIGGDEFVLLLEVTDATTVTARVEELHQLLLDQVVTTGLRVAVGGSVGVVVVDPSTESLDADTVLGRADEAMYQAKASGTNRVVVHDEADRLREVDRRQVEREIELALREDRVAVAYLPVVDLESGRVVGLEALARVHGSSGGPIETRRFIEVAEQTGLIVPLGEAVLRRAFADFAGWASADRDLVLTVNLSGRQLGQSGAVDRLVAATAAAGVPVHRLCVELSEVALVDLLEDLGAAVEQLRTAGVRLGLDDFGTAYSSLSRIRDLRVDVVKVDGTFVRRSVHDPVDAVVVSAGVQLAESLGISAVAEGIEDLEQLATVRRLGCRFGQGFHFGRPVPPEAVPDLLVRTFVTEG
jgi:diguanylate cyclase (GGDEF)-like protein/PAS domain S-box-containing protein